VKIASRGWLLLPFHSPEEAVAETSVRPSKLALGKGRITAT
jgi:hypothetical protein